jgi:hypothetical protein
MGREELGQRAEAAIRNQRETESRPLLDEERARSRRATGLKRAVADQRNRLQDARNRQAAAPAGSRQARLADRDITRANRQLVALHTPYQNAQEQLDTIRADPAFRQARNLTSREITDRDRQEWIDQRRREFAGPPGSDANLWAAGVDPAAHRLATPAQQEANLERSQAAINRDRQLYARIDGQGPVPGPEVRRARREVAASATPWQFNDRTRERAPVHRARIRRDRRQRRRLR